DRMFGMLNADCSKETRLNQKEENKMHRLKDVGVGFKGTQGTINAVEKVNLSIDKGDVYGIVGYSGAGKSTLVRTINLLQRPTKGSVWVNGQNMLALSPK